MKIEVQGEIEVVVTEKPFPKLMKSHYNGTIVFFESKEVGQVLVKGNYSYDVGRIANDWLSDNFTDLDPLTVITLQND